jgi:hypothetical protein
MYQFESKPPFRNIQVDIDRLKSLVSDLERARDGEHPDRRLIEAAPILDNWQLAHRNELCLVGTVSGHPKITNGRANLTSGLWLLSRQHGYARTLSRWYELGRQASDSRF